MERGLVNRKRDKEIEDWEKRVVDRRKRKRIK
jgi:hypothetical protein